MLLSWRATMFVIVLVLLVPATIAGSRVVELLKSIETNPASYETQLNKIVRDLQLQLKPEIEAKKTKSQYMMVASLDVQHDGAQAYSLLYKDNQSSQFFDNQQWGDYRKSRDCDPYCNKRLASIRTKRKRSLSDEDFIHTELMLLYGQRGKKFLADAANKKRIVLIYSHYVPCSQIPGSYGECAGDIAQYLNHQASLDQKNYHADPLRNYFIVVYESVYLLDDYQRSNECVSQLYMSLGGIPFFKFQARVYKFIPSDYSSNILQPKFQTFPRSPPHNRLKTLVDCLNTGHWMSKLLDKSVPWTCGRYIKYLLVWYLIKEKLVHSSESGVGPKKAQEVFGNCRKYSECYPKQDDYKWYVQLDMSTFAVQHSDTTLLHLLNFLRDNQLLEHVQTSVLTLPNNYNKVIGLDAEQKEMNGNIDCIRLVDVAALKLALMKTESSGKIKEEL